MSEGEVPLYTMQEELRIPLRSNAPISLSPALETFPISYHRRACQRCRTSLSEPIRLSSRFPTVQTTSTETFEI
jgi:hypothetical protein